MIVWTFLSRVPEVQKASHSGRLLELCELEEFEVEVGFFILVDLVLTYPFLSCMCTCTRIRSV